MSAPIVVSILLVAGVLIFLCGEQYGRSRERIVRERMRDRKRVDQIEERRVQSLRDVAWHGTERTS